MNRVSASFITVFRDTLAVCKAVAWIQQRASLAFAIVKSWRGGGGKTDNLKTCQRYIVKFKRHFKEPHHSLFHSIFFFLLSLSFFPPFLSFRTVADRLNRPMGLQVRDIGM